MKANSYPDLVSKLSRINACALELPSDLERNLLQAYVGCLTVGELAAAAMLSLDGSQEVVSAIRKRLVRLGKEGRALSEIDSLGNQLVHAAPSNPSARTRREALLSHMYPFLAPPTRQAVLERWRDRATRGTSARWLKAITSDELLFDVEAILRYWRETHDPTAAEVLVKRADSDLLFDVLPELIENCDTGWVISRGALRARSIPDEIWTAVRRKLPATYAYLCAKTNRNLTEQEAFAIINDCSVQDIGLAIWAIGQLNMSSVLDRIWEIRDQLAAKTLETYLANLS
jgi:hypothetical protein